MRSAVGAVNSFVTPYFAMISYGRAEVGVSRLPSKTTCVAPFARPPTSAKIGNVSQPTSAVHQYESCSSSASDHFTFAYAPTRKPSPACTRPFGFDVVPEV